MAERPSVEERLERLEALASYIAYVVAIANPLMIGLTRDQLRHFREILDQLAHENE